MPRKPLPHFDLDGCGKPHHGHGISGLLGTLGGLHGRNTDRVPCIAALAFLRVTYARSLAFRVFDEDGIDLVVMKHRRMTAWASHMP